MLFMLGLFGLIFLIHLIGRRSRVDLTVLDQNSRGPRFNSHCMWNFYELCSKASEGYVFTGVCHSFCPTGGGGGGVTNASWDRPLGQGEVVRSGEGTSTQPLPPRHPPPTPQTGPPYPPAQDHPPGQEPHPQEGKVIDLPPPRQDHPRGRKGWHFCIA